ncbi:glucose dehydrogenase [FAD, quinone]-like [Daktulosphaira vitifoliae]|uniref:glucose dehydrogenase [FAD, quinone]-like n=1 Tax=Daktulosphaira vitifoliae TaxID=58002 RepID=UPI0021AA147A|nr:glucose dehydrogenase [FAD, quinone]-like [Daktulosphaira vitifoliae]
MASIRISCLLMGLLTVFLGTEVHSYAASFGSLAHTASATATTTTRSVTTTTRVVRKRTWATQSSNKAFNINMLDMCHRYGYNVDGQFVVPEFMKLLNALNRAQCHMASEILYPRDYCLSIKDEDKVDLIVIGSGTAGSLLAAKLSDNRDLKVLLLEAGNLPLMTSEIPGLWADSIGTEMDWKYFAVADETFGQSLDGKKVNVIRGKCLGGTTAMNNMLYDRGLEKDYLYLESIGLTKWGWKYALKLYKKSEDCKFEKITTSKTVKNFHSQGGKVSVDSFRNTRTLGIRQSFSKAISSSNLKTVDYFDVKNHRGFVSSIAMIKNGLRLNAARAFLTDANRKYNLRVALKSTAKRLLFEDNKVVGVEFENSIGELIKVRVTEGVVLSAGPIGSPQLLLQSGIGPKSLLNSLAIPEVAVNERVGSNLQAHASFLGMIVSFETQPLKAYSISEMVYEYLLKQSGPLANIGLSSFTGFIDVNEDGTPDVQIHFYYYSEDDTVFMPSQLDAFNFNDNITEQIIDINENNDMEIVGISLLHPTNSGNVIIEKTDNGYKPVIKYGSLHEDDVTTLLKAIEWFKKVLTSEAFEKYGPKIVPLKIAGGPEPNVDSEEYWKYAIKHLTTMNVQMAGTCSIALNPSEGVVNQNLKVFGVENLWVADSSVIPRIFSTESSAPTLFVAEKANDIIKNQLGCKGSNESNEDDDENENN